MRQVHPGDPIALEEFRSLPSVEWDAIWYYEHCLSPALSRLVDNALFGGCYSVAVALHRRTGWKLAVLFDDFETRTSIHAFVLDDDENIVDAAGYRTLSELLLVYDVAEPTIEHVDLETMRIYCDVLTEEEIAKADALLARLPHHPWRRASVCRAISNKEQQMSNDFPQYQESAQANYEQDCDLGLYGSNPEPWEKLDSEMKRLYEAEMGALKEAGR